MGTLKTQMPEKVRGITSCVNDGNSQNYANTMKGDQLKNVFSTISFVPSKFELDLDHKIISYLFSLDGKGFTKEGKEDKTNPSKVKQWNNSKNPFIWYDFLLMDSAKNVNISTGLKDFFLKYLEIDEDANTRITFLEEGK